MSPTPKDWRVSDSTFEAWLRGTEKRIAHLERRPQVSRASDLMGPGLAPQAVTTTDWQGPEHEFNGFFVSEPGAMHSPDSGKWWLGMTLAQPDGFGVQIAWDYRSGTSPTPKYTRRFSLVGGTRMYSPWVLDTGSGGGGSEVTTLDGLDDVAILSPGTRDYLRFDGTTWRNSPIQANDLPVHNHIKHHILDFDHAASHAAGGGDAITPSSIGAAEADHSHDIADLPVAASGTSSATQVVRANDSRLSNARTPTAHASSHAEGGSDPITPASIGAATEDHTHASGPHDHDGQYAPVGHTHTKADITDFGHTHPVGEIAATGTADATTFLRGDGSWAVPTGGGGTVEPHTHDAADITTGRMDPARLGADLANENTYLRGDGYWAELPAASSAPVGSMMMYAGTSAPNGWMLCEGQGLSIYGYPELFDLIGYRYGGSGTIFDLPDMRGRGPVGADTYHPLGATGGQENMTLTTNHMPAHNHYQGSHNHDMTHVNETQRNDADGTANGTIRTASNNNAIVAAAGMVKSYNGNTSYGGGGYSSTEGGGDSFSIRNPYIHLNFIIKVQP